MWKLVIIVVLLCAAVWAIRTPTSKSRKRLTSPLKNPKKHLETEQILGKSHFQLSHSTPQAATYGITEKASKNDSIFAEPPEFEAQDEAGFDLGAEEELDDASPTKGAEYGSGVDLGSMIEAFSTAMRTDALPEERQRAAEILTRLQGTETMDQLCSEPQRAANIDELINERLAQLTKNRKDYLPN